MKDPAGQQEAPGGTICKPESVDALPMCATLIPSLITVCAAQMAQARMMADQARCTSVQHLNRH